MVQINDKKFRPIISQNEIEQRISELAVEINRDYQGKHPLFITILNGAFLFAAELFKRLEIDCEITFTRLASYLGTSSTGKVNILMQLSDKVQDKDVIILEDIVDTGKTLARFLPHLNLENPASVKIASLLVKPTALEEDIIVDYAGFEIEDKFVIGYGLDYDGLGRNLAGIYQLIKE